jgi:hypothetical protein
MYFRKKTSGGRAYLQIVASRRDGGQVRQQVIATLGRYEDLRESGQGKYPPAEPGALGIEPLEAAGGVADAAPI